MTEDALKIYEECVEFHLKLTKMCVQLESKMTASGNIKEQVDAALVARESAKAMEHLGKQLRKLEYLTTQICCTLWATSPLGGSRIKTEYCSALPSVVYRPNTPSFTGNPEKYKAAMRALGIPEQLAEMGCVNLHWKRFCEYVTMCKEQGLPLPEGISVDDVVPKFTLNARSNGKLGHLTSGALTSDVDSNEESKDEHGHDPF